MKPEDDEPLYEDVAWDREMACLAITTILILTVVALTGFAFWLLEWI